MCQEIDVDRGQMGCLSGIKRFLKMFSNRSGGGGELISDEIVNDSPWYSIEWWST